MVHWPKTVGGNVLGLLLAVVVVATVVQASIALSGPLPHWNDHSDSVPTASGS
jgi:hypothetical protein